MLPETAAATLAVSKIGAVYIPIFSGYGAEAVAMRLRDAEASVLLTVDGFLRLLEGTSRQETDHSVLDEVISRFSWIEHRGVSDADRPALHSWIRRLFAPAASELGWDAREGEDDERRLRRAAVLRALALVARDPRSIEEAQERFHGSIAPQPRPLDPNLLDVVVAAAARTADRARFAELRRRAEEELDPAAKRRFLHALAMVEHPDLVAEEIPRLEVADSVPARRPTWRFAEVGEREAARLRLE